MPTNIPLSHKSISRLGSKGLALEVLRSEIDDGLNFTLELWRAQGVNIVKKNGYFYFATKFTPVNEATFCIVDIETNGSKIEKHQIIEIAALKIRNGKVIDRFESLVQCDTINEVISELTGIQVEDTKNAPSLEKVLSDFKIFLDDSVFVAHDVKFDYNFISASFEKIGLEAMMNRALCSLALAERTVVSYRYALSYLSRTLGLNPNATHHRAMSDVQTTYELFLLSLNKCTQHINNVEDLIRFSKEAPRLKRPKFDPFLEEEEEKKIESS